VVENHLMACLRQRARHRVAEARTEAHLVLQLLTLTVVLGDDLADDSGATPGAFGRVSDQVLHLLVIGWLRSGSDDDGRSGDADPRGEEGEERAHFDAGAVQERKKGT